MQVSYQTDNLLQRNTSPPNSAVLSLNGLRATNNFKDGQTDLTSHKAQNEVYGNSRIYSPYLTPSNAVIINLKASSAEIDIAYMHNVARTKYFNVSKPPKPAEHYKINLLA